MTTYTVYLPPHGADKNQEDGFRLVPDSKAKLALFFPPLWLAWQRLWLALLAYCVFMVAILMIASSGEYVIASYLSALPGLYLLLEGYELVRQKLERNGWRYVGIVEAKNLDEAEIRFMLDHEDKNPVSALQYQTYSSDIKPAEKSGRKLSGNAPISSNQSLFPE